VAKWKNREDNKGIAQSVVSQKTTEQLREAKTFIEGLLELRRSEKLEKTYIQGTKSAIEYNGNNKVYVDFRFDGTATGRLSCAAYSAKEDMGVSFHTLPRDTKHNIRSIFVAPKGTAFITVDYAAMELRVLAHIAKEKIMQKAFIDGADLHTYTAELLFNKKNITKEERQIAKTVSFLIVYGGGAFNLSETMGIPLKRAEKIIDNYRKVYPGIFSYMEFVNRFIRENHYAYTIFGRRRNLPDVTSEDQTVVNRALRQGLNFTIQSTASDILLSGLLGCCKEFSKKGLLARPVATVHDSLEVVCPVHEVEHVLEIIYDQLVNVPIIKKVFNLEFSVPLKIDAEVGHSFGDGKEVHFHEGKPQNITEILEYLK
jgi:DNA polymerase-1